MKLGFSEIPKRRHVCTQSQHPFNPGDRCHTLVYEMTGGWKCEDLCEECWQAIKNKGMPRALSSYWQTKIPPKPTHSNSRGARAEKALLLLKDSLGEGSLQSQNEAFILALYLARKKILHFRQELEQLGTTIHLYEVAATEELLAVKKMPLKDMEVQAIQTRLINLLT